MTGPRLLPRRPTGTPRQVILPKEMWDRLKEAAKFHSAAFKAMGSTEGVSRNDLIAEFLEWALASYWEQVGGVPTDKAEWAERVKEMSSILRDAQGQSEPGE